MPSTSAQNSGRSVQRQAQAMRKADVRRLDVARYGAAVVAAAALYPGLVGPDLWRFPAGVVCGAALTRAVRAARQARAAEARRAQARLKVAAISARADHDVEVVAPVPEPAPAPVREPGSGRRRRAEDVAVDSAEPPVVEAVPAGESVPPAEEPAPARRRRSEPAGRGLPRPKDRRRKADVPGARRTEDALRTLAREGWVIRPDLAQAFHGIAHVAIGPPGVFLLDSSNWDNDITVDDAGVPHTRRLGGAGELGTPDRIPRQMRVAAAEHHDTLASLLGGKRPWVHAVAVVWAPWDAESVEASGVAYVRGDALTAWLRNRRPVYTPGEVTALVDALTRLPVNIGHEYAR